MDAAVRPLPATSTIGTGLTPRAERSLRTVALRLGRTLLDILRDAWAPEQRALMMPLVVLSVVSTLATAASPWLGHWPLLLALLTPRLPFLVLAAPVTPLPIFLVAGTARLCVADPFHFLLGRRLGEHLQGSGRLRRLVDRFGTPGTFAAIALRPIGRHLFVAGATRSNVALVAVADIASTMIFLLAVHRGLSLLG